MKNKRTIIITIISALILVSILGFYLLQGFVDTANSGKGQVFKSFYNEEPDSLDGVYFGASSVARYWVPALAFEETGITIPSLATTAQPFVMTKHMMKEAKKTQDDAIFIIELRCIYKDPSYTEEEEIRRATDNLKPSISRMIAIKDSLDDLDAGGNTIEGSALAVYFPALESVKRILNGKLTIGEVSFQKDIEESPYKGFRLDDQTFQQFEVPESQYNTTDKVPLDPAGEEILNDLLDYCDSIDNEVLFVVSPYSADKSTYPEVNTAIDIIENRGHAVYNMAIDEMVKDIGIDWTTDFYNSKHTNRLGAEKYTRFLAEYLAEHYHLEDHREDPVFSDWHDAWEIYKETVYEMPIGTTIY